MQMNIMGNVKEPFLSQDRFEVTFTTSPLRYGFHLFIAGMRYNTKQDVAIELNYRFYFFFTLLSKFNNKVLESACTHVIAPRPVMCSFMLICQCCFAIVKVLLKKVTYLLT